MNLSNRLTFSLVFSVLLVALFAFIATPAMAQVTATVVGAAPDDGGVVVTITFSENLSPKLKKADLTANGTDALAGTIAFAETNAKTYTLTSATSSIVFQMPGYQLAGTASISVDADTAATALDNDPAYLGGKAYVVYVKNVGSLPEFQTPGPPLQTWAEMPNLEEFFNVGGGTIDLNVTDTTADSRRVVIYEVMWGVDNANVGVQDDYIKQQWIEVYNPKTTPIAYAVISFSTIPNASGLRPPAAIAAETADRLSNIPSFVHTWAVKGSSGSSILDTAVIVGADPMFGSMYRNDIRGGGEGSGTNSSNWSASTLPYLPGFLGTPGGANTRASVPPPRTTAGPTNPPKDKIIVNEVGLSETAGHDWIELKNISGGAVNIKKWTISLATGYNTEKIIYRFQDNDRFPGNNHLQSIPAGGHLLLVFDNPAATPLAVGVNVLLPDRDQAFGHSDHKFLDVTSGGGNAVDAIPGDGVWFIIIRSNNQSKYLQSSHHIQDVAGPGGRKTLFIVKDLNAASPRKDKKSDGNAGGAIWHTDVWPLHSQRFNNNDAVLQKTNLPNENTAWFRRTNKGGGQGWKHESFGNWGGNDTGAGYDRGADPSKYKGTPGYPNDSHKARVGDITDGKVIISEIMLTTTDGRYPQWIELHNTSKTSSVNLDADDGWRLVIENHDSDQWGGKRDLAATINFKSNGDVKSIPPNQTVMLVSTISSRDSSKDLVGHFPEHRVYDVYTHDRGAFYMPNRRAPFLNTNGFHIKLIDGKGNVSDEIGNLDGNNRTYDAPYSWEWPAAMTADDERSSLIRVKNANGTYRVGVPDRTVEGDMRGAPAAIGQQVGAMSAWIHAVDTNLALIQDTYYGSQDDFGTPGHTSNTPLPVSLSFFRPTLENGEVVIRWTTESELDNAGFNILRSDSQDGEFKQVNSELVQGAGTTGERNTYKLIDESAKPGVIYYYQIEDVSFAGEHQTLTTTKLKGLISAGNKQTLIWGELKEVQ